MSLRLVPLLLLLALTIAPFGRIAAAHGMAMPAHGAPMVMAGHCDDPSMPAPAKPDRAAIDCMIACSAVAPRTASLPDPIAPAAAPFAPLVPAGTAIFSPESEPPPPRCA